MTDQTRWHIDEVQLKNKIKKYQDDNFNKAINSAQTLTKINLIHLMNRLEHVLKDKEIDEESNNIK